MSMDKSLCMAIPTGLSIRAANMKTSRRNRMEMLNRCQQHDNIATIVFITIVVVFIICQQPASIAYVLRTETLLKARIIYQLYLRHACRAKLGRQLRHLHRLQQTFPRSADSNRVLVPVVGSRREDVPW